MKVRFAIFLVLAAALVRLLPHPYNFTPIGAMALFSAAHFRRDWLMLAVPFGSLFLSDLLLNNLVYSNLYDHFALITSWWIYAAFALVMGIGLLVLRSKSSPARVAIASLLASVAFFFVTNFSVWAESALYPKTGVGLAECFAAGIPFFSNTLLGDLFFSAVLFGTFEWAQRRNFFQQLA